MYRYRYKTLSILLSFLSHYPFLSNPIYLFLWKESQSDLTVGGGVGVGVVGVGGLEVETGGGGGGGGVCKAPFYGSYNHGLSSSSDLLLCAVEYIDSLMRFLR
jgi:hypothetical protein